MWWAQVAQISWLAYHRRAWIMWLCQGCLLLVWHHCSLQSGYWAFWWREKEGSRPPSPPIHPCWHQEEQSPQMLHGDRGHQGAAGRLDSRPLPICCAPGLPNLTSLTSFRLFSSMNVSADDPKVAPCTCLMPANQLHLDFSDLHINARRFRLHAKGLIESSWWYNLKVINHRGMKSHEVMWHTSNDTRTQMQAEYVSEQMLSLCRLLQMSGWFRARILQLIRVWGSQEYEKSDGTREQQTSRHNRTWITMQSNNKNETQVDFLTFVIGHPPCNGPSKTPTFCRLIWEWAIKDSQTTRYSIHFHMRLSWP